jgi:hypothetical protein
MRHDRRLRRGSRAGGVAELRGVLVLRAALVDAGRVLVERGRQDVVVAATDQSVFCDFRLAAHSVDGRYEIGVVEQGLRAGLVENVFQFACGQRVIDRHMHEAGAGATEPQQEIGVRILGVGADAVTLREARARQPMRDAAGGGVYLGERPFAARKRQRDAATIFGGGAPYRVRN